MSLLALLGAVLGCRAEGSVAPSLVQLSPATVSTRIDTTVTLHGHNLFGYATSSFNESAPPAVDERWTVEVGTELFFDATLIDSQQLEVLIPAGTPTGLFDIAAIAADGRRAELPDALTVIAGAPLLDFRIAAIAHPQSVIPGTKGIPVTVRLENGLAETVPLTGFALDIRTEAGADVGDEYYIVPAAENPHEVGPGQTALVSFMVGVDSTATRDTIAVVARVDGFVRSSKNHVELRFDSSWDIVEGTPLAPLPSAPTSAEATICAGESIDFDGSTSVGDGALAFLWDLPGSDSISSTSATPREIRYSQAGSFLYALTLEDSVSSAIRFAPTPIYVGAVSASPSGQHAAGPILFSRPTSNQAIDLAELPSTSIIARDASGDMRQCDGSEIDRAGRCYLTFFTDRGRIDLDVDTEPAIAGLQVELAHCTHIHDFNFDQDAAGLEGSGLLYAESRDATSGVVTASGSATFHMTNDRTAPTIELLVPAASCSSACYGAGQRLLFHFSEPMATASLSNTLVEVSSASNCEGTFSDITGNSTVSYDADSRTLAVTPPQEVPASYSVRVSFPTTITDASSNANPLVAPHTECFVVSDRSASLPSVAPSNITTTPAAFSPDGDGQDESVQVSAVVDANSALLVASIQRGSTIVRKLVSAPLGAGAHQLVWDGRDNTGRVAPNGYYAVHLHTENAEAAVSQTTVDIVEVASAVSLVGIPNRF